MNGLCYCGSPITGQRRKFCSDECKAAMRDHNIAAYIAPVEAEEADQHLPELPDGYEGTWFTPDELRKRNADLTKLGKRICRVHQGAALPLDNEHFHWRNKSKGLLHYECKACHTKRIQANERRRYHANPVYAERRKAANRATYQRNRAKRLKYTQEYKLRKRREQFARILGGAA